MSADFTPEKEDYKILTPFKMQVLTNFPYIEADFDALTNYQLLCKIVEYLNNVITNENEVTEQVTSLYNAYVALQNYVNTYFDNLDLQEEVNTKIDEMAEDGTLTNIIKNYVDPIEEAFEAAMQLQYNNFESTVSNRLLAQDTDITTFKGTINQQVAQIDNKVDNATSGSPKGVYPTVSDLETADPNHDYIYVVSADGKWYYYDTTLSAWTAGGTYQSTGISTSDPVISDLINAKFYDQRNTVVTGINMFREDYVYNGYWIAANGQKAANADSKYAIVPLCGGNKIQLCLNKTFTTYTSAALGGLVLLDKDLNTIQVLAYEDIVNDPAIYGYYNTFLVCTIEIPTGCCYLMFTIKLANSYNISPIIVYGDKTDFTVTNYAVDLFEMPKKIRKIYNESLYDNLPYNGIKWAVFGDSLTEVNSTAQTKYYDYISENLGMSIVNYGVSGSGYRSGYDDNASFYQRMANIDPDDFDFITIFGSGNDIKYLKNGTMQLGNATDFCAINQEPTNIAMAINRTIEQYRIITPTKPIGLITPTPWYAYCQSWKLNYGDAQLMQDYSNLIVEIGKLRGIPVLNLYNESNLCPWNIDNRTYYYNENGVQDGGTHPNSIGHKLISASIEEFIKTVYPQK